MMEGNRHELLQPRGVRPEEAVGEDAAVMEGFSLCGQMVLDWLDETAEGMTAYGGVPIFDVIYSQVAHDIRQHVADLLDGRRVELTVSPHGGRTGALRSRLAANLPIPPIRHFG